MCACCDSAEFVCVYACVPCVRESQHAKLSHFPCSLSNICSAEYCLNGPCVGVCVCARAFKCLAIGKWIRGTFPNVSFSVSVWRFSTPHLPGRTISAHTHTRAHRTHSTEANTHLKCAFRLLPMPMCNSAYSGRLLYKFECMRNGAKATEFGNGQRQTQNRTLQRYYIVGAGWSNASNSKKKKLPIELAEQIKSREKEKRNRHDEWNDSNSSGAYTERRRVAGTVKSVELQRAAKNRNSEAGFEFRGRTSWWKMAMR